MNLKGVAAAIHTRNLRSDHKKRSKRLEFFFYKDYVVNVQKKYSSMGAFTNDVTWFLSIFDLPTLIRYFTTKAYLVKSDAT